METLNVTVDGKDHSVNIPSEWMSLDENELKARIASEVRAIEAEGRTGGVADVAQQIWNSSGLPGTQRWDRALEIARESREAGSALFQEGVEAGKTGRAPLEATWKTLLGGLQYVLSPIEGVARGYAGEPAGELTAAALDAYSRLAYGEDALTQEELKERGRFTPSQAVEEFVTAGSQVFTPMQYAKAVQAIAPVGTELYGPMRYLAGQPKPPPVTVGSADAPPSSVAAADRIPPVVDETPIPVDTTKGAVPRLSVGAVEDIVTEPGIITKVARARSEIGGDKERFFRTVGRYLQEGLENGEITAGSLPRIVEDLGLSPTEMADFFRVSVSESGRTLNLLSQAVRRMSKDKTYSPEIRSELDAIAGRMELGQKVDMEYVANAWRKAENFRRGMLVGQVATTMRNISTQAGRLTVGMIDEALQAGLRGANAKESLTGVWNSLSSDMGALPVIRKMTGGKKIIDDILDGNPITKERLLNRTVHEVESIHKFVAGVNKFNTLQERFFRRMAFQARLTKTMKEQNLPMNGPIPAELMEDAVEHALEMTFAASGGKFARNIVDAFHKLPLLYSVNPFPRFSYANALPFVAQHSPWGLAKAFSPRTVAQLASGNPREFAKAASRGLLGTIFLSKAVEMRNSDNAGEKWYEWQVGDKTINLLPFAPFSTYLFLAEAMKDDSHITAKDYMTAAIGLNRISGTGLVMIDAIRQNDIQGTADALKRFAGQYLSSPTVPLRTIKDFYEGITGHQTSPDIRADTIWEEIVNPTISNMPYVAQFVHERKTPLRVGTAKLEPIEFFGFEMPGPIARQLTGLTLIKKTEVEHEVHRLNLNPSTYMPRTGFRKADRWVAATMAPTVTMLIPQIMESDEPIADRFDLTGTIDPGKSYSELDDSGKEIVMGKLFTLIRNFAMSELQRRQPKLWGMTALGKKYSTAEAQYMKDKLGFDPKDKAQLQMLFNQ